MTVRELVALGRYPWHGALGRFGSVDREQVEDAIKLVGLQSFAQRTGGQPVRGERQRAWLAMDRGARTAGACCWTSPPRRWISPTRWTCWR